MRCAGARVAGGTERRLGRVLGRAPRWRSGALGPARPPRRLKVPLGFGERDGCTASCATRCVSRSRPRDRRNASSKVPGPPRRDRGAEERRRRFSRSRGRRRAYLAELCTSSREKERGSPLSKTLRQRTKMFFCVLAKRGRDFRRASGSRALSRESRSRSSVSRASARRSAAVDVACFVVEDFLAEDAFDDEDRYAEDLEVFHEEDEGGCASGAARFGVARRTFRDDQHAATCIWWSLVDARGKDARDPCFSLSLSLSLSLSRFSLSLSLVGLLHRPSEIASLARVRARRTRVLIASRPVPPKKRTVRFDGQVRALSVVQRSPLASPLARSAAQYALDDASHLRSEEGDVRAEDVDMANLMLELAKPQPVAPLLSAHC